MSDSVRPHRRKPTRLACPWDSPGKNTGVGCHFLLQCMKVKSEREVAQSCPTLSNPMDSSLPGSSIHGIFQARVLEWGAIAFSKVISNLSQTSNQFKELNFIVWKISDRYFSYNSAFSNVFHYLLNTCTIYPYSFLILCMFIRLNPLPLFCPYLILSFHW